MNRRQLFCALSALAVIPVAALGGPRHRLIGDGEHDDSEAFQALMDGEPVMMPDGSIQQLRYGKPVCLGEGQTYLLNECIYLSSGTHLEGGHFKQTGPVGMRVRTGARDIALRYCRWHGSFAKTIATIGKGF
jgi:hypothetical protein